MQEEKRIHPRIDFHHPVIIKGLRGLKKIMNFSTGGAFIHTDKSPNFKQGIRINLLTQLPLQKKNMLIRAQIIHVSPKGIGVRFMGLSRTDSNALDYNFEVFKGTLPLPGA